MPVRRGEIYWVDFDPVKGSEQAGLRPALVVQNDVGNRSGETTIVAALTRTIPSRPYPFIVMIEATDSGLSERGTVNCAQLATIQQAGRQSRLRPARGDNEARPIGRLSAEKMAEVDRALKKSLGLEL